MSEQDETAPVETTDEAPVTEAAPEENGAPAGPPEGYIEQSRYDNLRAEHNRKQALWDRAQQGDLEAMRELNLPVDFGDDADLEDEEPYDGSTEVADPVARQLIQQMQADQGRQRFNADLDGLLAEKKMTFPSIVRDAVFNETVRRGDGLETLKTVVDELASEYEAQTRAAVDEAFKVKKNAPRPSAVGTGATEVPPEDLTPQQLARWAAERYSQAREG